MRTAPRGGRPPEPGDEIEPETAGDPPVVASDATRECPGEGNAQRSRAPEDAAGNRRRGGAAGASEAVGAGP
eukprot:2380225-Lingulodinium_polyedra.AAC.1